MTNTIVFIIILIFLMICLAIVYSIKNLEHFTTQSDEAIQNVASLYNKDNLTIGSMNVTGETNTGSMNVTGDTTTGSLSTKKIQLGKQFDILSGLNDSDTYIRIYKRGIAPNTNLNPADYHSIAVADLHSFSAGQSMTSLHNRISALENTCVRKGPVTISASYGGTYPRDNMPLRISDGWFLRAYPTPSDDNNANSLGSKLSISQ